MDFYRTQSAWSDPGRWTTVLAEIQPEPGAILRALSGLLLHPFFAAMRGIAIPPEADADRGVRAVETMLDALRARDPRPLTAPRAAEGRFFCVCAGYARLATAVFRAHGVAARCRVGFAAYFNPRKLEDHWVCEYRAGDRWRLLDAQLDERAVRDLGIRFAPTDVPREEFLDASTAWRRARAGELDPATMGLSVLGLAGTWFVADDVMLDVAALNKIELLPWEKWSVGATLGPGADVPPDVAARFDRVAAELAGTPDAEDAQRVYRENPWLAVTPTVTSFLSGAPFEVAIEAARTPP
jgi:hypothetical protein